MFKLVTTITVNRRISSHWVHCRITKQTPYTFSGAVMSLFISEILKSWIQNSIIISLWRKISINSPLRWFFFFNKNLRCRNYGTPDMYTEKSFLNLVESDLLLNYYWCNIYNSRQWQIFANIIQYAAYIDNKLTCWTMKVFTGKIWLFNPGEVVWCGR